MYTEARKLHIIEAVLKTDDEVLLNNLEAVISKAAAAINKPKARFSELVGILTGDEAEAMKAVIEEQFEKINPDDWK